MSDNSDILAFSIGNQKTMDAQPQLSTSKIPISVPHPSQSTPPVSHPTLPPQVTPRTYTTTPVNVSVLRPPSPSEFTQAQVPKCRPPQPATQPPPSNHQLTPRQQPEPLHTSQPLPRILQQSPCIHVSSSVSSELNTNGHSHILVRNDFPAQTRPSATFTQSNSSGEWCSPSTQPPPPQPEPGAALFTSVNVSEDSSPLLSASPPTRGLRLPSTPAPSLQIQPPPPPSEMLTCSDDGFQPSPLQPPPPPCAMFTRIACSEEGSIPPPPSTPPPLPEQMFTGVPYTYETTTGHVSSARDLFACTHIQSELFTRASPDDSEYTNRIRNIESDNTNIKMLEKQDRRIDVHPNIDHLDEVDGAMFSRISQKQEVHPNIDHLDEVDGAMFSRISQKQEVHPNIDHLDEVDGAMFSRIPQRIDTFSASLGLHHTQPSDAASDDVDAAVCQCVSDNGIVTSNRGEDTATIHVSRGNSTFFIDLETYEQQDGVNVNSYLPNISLPESKSASSRDIFGIDNSKYANNVSNALHPEHDARFTQSDANTFVTTEYLSNAGISNQRTNAGREYLSITASPHIYTPYTTEYTTSPHIDTPYTTEYTTSPHIDTPYTTEYTTSPHIDTPYTTEYTTSPHIDTSYTTEYTTSPHIDTPYTTEYLVKSELKSRGIGMRINYSMCDINHLDNIQPLTRNVVSCNDVIMTNSDFSLLSSRLNLSTSRLSVHNAITNTLAPGEGLRRTHSEELKPTSSSECQLHKMESIESDRLLGLESKCPEEMHRLSISLSDFTANESHLRDTYPIPEIKLEHTEQVNSKPHETALLIAGPERSSSLTESNVAILGGASLHENGTDSSGFDFEKRNDDRRITGMWNLMKAYAAVVFAVASALLFLADIGTDLRLAGMYHHNGSYTLFSITLAFIIAPSILMGIVDISWIFLDRKSSNLEHGGRIWISVRLLFGLLSFGRVIRACAFIRHRVKSLGKGDNRDWHAKRALEEKRDYYMLDFINAFSECAPQLLVQLYLMYKFSLDLLVLERVVSLLSSWISIAWTYTAYNKCHRDALPNKNETTTLAFICLLLSLLPALAARFICFALFMTYFDAWIPAALFGSHFVLMIFVIHCQNPSLLGTVTSKWGRTLYIIFFAYVSLFSFVNLRDDRSRVRMSIFYVLFYVETFVITALVYWRAGLVEYETSDSRTHRELCLIAVPVCAFLHISLLSLYYTVFHPTTGRLKRQPPKNLVYAMGNIER